MFIDFLPLRDSSGFNPLGPLPDPGPSSWFTEALLEYVYLASAIYGVNVIIALECLRASVMSTERRTSRLKTALFNGYVLMMACLGMEAIIEDTLSSAAYLFAEFVLKRG